MATQDLSRLTTDWRLNYRGVRGQTGRVLTDEDLTEIDALAAEERRSDRLGIIGEHGTSNDGYRISVVQNVGGSIDFSIGAGDYWVGGLRAALAVDQAFRLQTDWLQMPDTAAPSGARHDLAVLEVWEQIVSANEDAALFEPALAGPDTTARRRVMARVRLVTDLAAGDCADLWAEALNRFRAAGLGSLAADHELAGDGTLTIGFTGNDDTEDLCSPSIAQGFLGAANQAIRVQIAGSGEFVWGFENGGRLMRATVAADGRTLTLLTEPRDEAHWPAPGQVIQVLPWGAVLANGEKLAEEIAPGHFSRVETAYDPDTQILIMEDAVAAGFGTAWEGRADAAALRTTRFGQETLDAPYVFVRIWDRGEDRSSAALLSVGANVPLGTTGLTATITGAALRPCDHWIVAARPHAPAEIAPWDLTVSKAYVGYRRHIAPLAHLIWQPGQDPVAIDCRHRFRPLTRTNDCITLRVGDGAASHGDYTSIQAAVNALPPAGGRILVLPGRYDERIRIDGRSNIRIEGCGSRTRIFAPDAEDGPVIAIADSQTIEIRDLVIFAEDQLAVAAVHGTRQRAGCIDIRCANLDIRHFQRGGIAFVEVDGGQIAGCWLRCEGEFTPRNDPASVIHRPAVFLSGNDLELRDSRLTGASRKSLSTALGGVQIGGGSRDVTILGNHIEGCYGHGVTLGSISYVPARVATHDASLSKYYVSSFGQVQVYTGFYLTDDNCFGLDPVSPPTDPETGEDLVPISDGPLRRILIEENIVTRMGGCGISVVQFFDLANQGEMISVDDLVILRNRIVAVLVGENVAYPSSIAAVAAWGAIALGDVSRVEIRENLLFGNARTHPLPCCGIFALFAEDMQVVENRIQNNGFRVDERDDSRSIGWRGGVIVGQTRPGALDIVDDDDPDAPRRSDGGPALRVHGNVIVAPQGRAVTTSGLGPIQITDNRLVTQSGGMNGWLVAASGIRTGTLDMQVLAVSMARIAEAANEMPNMLTGHAMLAAMGGEIVAVGNSGFSSEFYLQGAGLSTAPYTPAEDDAFDYQGSLLAGGDVMLTDNQMRLDGLDGRVSASISAVALYTMDSVVANDNQISLDLSVSDFVAIDLMALGWSLMISGNRLKEPLINCFLSAMTVGLMNTTALNQATHCILAYAPDPLLVDHGNSEMVEIFLENRICDSFRNGIAGLGKRAFD